MPEGRFNDFDIAAMMVEENCELYTINYCEVCYNLRQDERKESGVKGKQWKRLVGAKRSPGKLAVGPSAIGFEHRIMNIHARKKIYAKNLQKEPAAAMSQGKEWVNESPHEEGLASLRRTRTCHCWA